MADNNKDVRELLKLKQGLIDEKDSDIQETGYDVRMAQTASEKTKNFLWYHKAMIAGGIVLIILAVIIYLAFFVKKKPDITIYSIGNYAMSVRTNFENTMAQYTPDFDGNGYVHVAVYSIDLTKSGNMQYIQSNTAKFYGEIERGVAELYICDADLLTSERASEEYDPDDESMTLTYENMFSDIGEALGIPEYNGKLRIDLNDTGFVYAAKWENSCPDTLAFSIRREIPGMVSYSKSGEYQKRAKEVLTNILTGNKVNEAAENNSSEQGE